MNTYMKASLAIDMANKFSLRACLHGGGGPQVSGVTRLGGVACPYNLLYGHSTHHVNVIKLK